MSTNVSSEETLSGLFRVLGQPARVQILLVIGSGSACVCHLEAYLGMRQALISQHLMVLRESGLVDTRREGRNIYYHLTRPEILGLVRSAASLTRLDWGEFENGLSRPLNPCPCPHCNPEKPGIVCSSELPHENIDHRVDPKGLEDL
jgi:DNA-binding transcriptional ArsR family regulator